MTMVDMKQVFIDCEYPYYKDVELNQGEVTCTVYSVRTDYKEVITLPIMSYEQVIHVLSLAIIKLRSFEMIQ